MEFDARPLTGVSIDYGKILVEWRTPSGDWDLLRLNRDSFGFVPRADYGTTLVESPKVGAPTSVVDSGLQTGRFYYYTVWVRAVLDGQWRRAGDVIALATHNWGVGGQLFERVPNFYRLQDQATPGFSLYGKGQLERFLLIPGFEADHIRSEYESLKWVNDPDRVSGGLLPLMARQLGFGYETELGMRLVRQQMRNAVHIFKHKGAQLGIEAFASVMTGWAPTVVVGHNLVLDQNDSSFKEGTGRWVSVGNTTLGRRDVSDESPPGAIAGPVDSPPGASTGDAGSGDWMLLLTADDAGDMVIQSFAVGIDYDNRTYGIPVQENTGYLYSLYSRALDTVADVQLGVEWFDAAGASLGVVTENAAASNATGDWTRHMYSVYPVPRGRFLRLQVRVVSAAQDDRHLIDAVQLEGHSNHLTYNQASLETDATGWSSSGNAPTLESSDDVALDGSRSLKITSTATGSTQAVTTPNIPVVQGKTYTARANIRGGTTGLTACKVQINWRDENGGLLTTLDGNAFNSTTNWQESAAVGQPEPGATLMSIKVLFNSTSIGDVIYADYISVVESDLGDYQGARAVRIQFQADRVNLVKNASFEVDDAGWEASGNSAVAQTTDQAAFGSNSLEVTSLAAGATYAQISTGSAFPVVENQIYTASAYFRAATDPRTAQLWIRWLDDEGTVLGNSALSQEQANSTTGWARGSVTAAAPAGATQAVVPVQFLGTGDAGEIHYVDGVLVERGTTVGDFFDGASFSNEGEYMWQVDGDPGNTASHYYSRRLIKNFRLNQRLSEFLPAGASWALLYAGAE